MRGRHRHFNPKAAGATAVFDARFGLTMANGAVVDTWTNRAGGNNATQSTNNLRPLYRATGGNANTPAVEFDGSNDYLVHNIGITVAPNLIMAVAKRTGGGSISTIASFTPPNTANFNAIYARIPLGVDTNWGFVPEDSGQTILNEYKICSAVPASTSTVSSSTTMWTNGANEKTATGSRYGGDVESRRHLGAGLAGGELLLGSISQVIAIPADISAALRRRLEKAAAYSFRLACS